jgi:hypothetical protein
LRGVKVSIDVRAKNGRNLRINCSKCSHLCGGLEILATRDGLRERERETETERDRDRETDRSGEKENGGSSTDLTTVPKGLTVMLEVVVSDEGHGVMNILH